MRKRGFWIILSCLMALSLVLTSCTTEEEEEEEEGVVVEEEEEDEEEEGGPPVTGNWWDKFGEPEYGGTLTIREGALAGMTWDPSNPMGAAQTQFCIETMFQNDWAVDRAVWPFNMGFTPTEYMTGAIAESWELTDPLTWTVNIRQGIHFQDKAPVNGRELTAQDVQYSYDWLLGTGSGFAQPNPLWAAVIPSIDRVVATDKYTVEYRLKEPSAMALLQIMEGAVMRPWPIVAHEWLEQGDIGNWKNAVGTGPFLLTDFVEGSSITFSRNPNYWGYDERHPQYQLPYIDTLKMVSIPDMSTSMAALRTGKVDMIVQTRGGMTWQQAKSLAKTNPEIEQVWFPNPGFSIDMRCDNPPFTDISVRKALQMAVDRQLIAQTHYGGAVDGTPSGVANPIYAKAGWIIPYDEWSQELKEEYSYNPTRAKELLAEAGYPDGFKANCVASTADDMNLLQIMKAMFLDIGVDMDIEAMEGVAYRPYVQAGKAEELIYTSVVAMPFSPDWSIRRRESTNINNFTKNNDPVYDQMIADFDAAATIEEAKRISTEADQYLLQQHWAVQTFSTVVAFAWQPYVKGYMGENMIGSYGYMHVSTRLWIDQELKSSMGR